MAGITTAMCSSFKGDILSALHCFNAIVTPTGNTHTSTLVDNVSSLTGVAVGMTISGSGVTAGTVISRILSSTSFQLDTATSSSLTATTLTLTGDAFKFGLIKHTPTGTYDSTSTNYTNVTGNSDEATGAGYTVGGFALTNVSPVVAGSTAYITFSANPSWTSATLDVDGGLVYNNSQRGPIATRAAGFFDFGGEQKVTAGTLTVVLPAAANTTAIIRIQ